MISVRHSFLIPKFPRTEADIILRYDLKKRNKIENAKTVDLLNCLLLFPALFHLLLPRNGIEP